VSDRDDDWTGDDAESTAAPDTSGGSDPDPDPEPTRAGGTDDAGTPSRPSVGASQPRGGDRSIRTYLLWAALLTLGVMVVVATAGLYSSLSSVITVWIGDRYRPIARAVLNFGVLCVAAAGIAVILRRL